MDDTSNWEFAASVAAICIGLGGLLLFTIVGTLGSWRTWGSAQRASNEAAAANIEVQALARQLAAQAAQQSAAHEIRESADELRDLRGQADALVAQQARLLDAVRNLVEAGVLGSEDAATQIAGIDAGVRRLEDHLKRLADALAETAANGRDA